MSEPQAMVLPIVGKVLKVRQRPLLRVSQGACGLTEELRLWFLRALDWMDL